MELFIYLFFALFSVLNPIGTIPIFVGLTQDYSPKDRARVSLKTSINVCIILLISFDQSFSLTLPLLVLSSLFMQIMIPAKSTRSNLAPTLSIGDETFAPWNEYFLDRGNYDWGDAGVQMISGVPHIFT
jgi:hypothetical protein